MNREEFEALDTNVNGVLDTKEELAQQIARFVGEAFAAGALEQSRGGHALNDTRKIFEENAARIVREHYGR